MNSRCYWSTSIVLISFIGLAAAQENIDQPSLDKINQASITATVKFLASDELAGRDTPSPGLDQASDYVADRFQQAGLEPLGTEGTFFQITEAATAQAPLTAVVTGDGKPVQVLGVLSANTQAFGFEGAVTKIDFKNIGDQQFSGPVTFELPPFNQPSIASAFPKRLAQLRQQGATACVIQCSPRHRLVARAPRAGKLHLKQEFAGIEGPVILTTKADFQAVTIQMAAQVEGTAKLKNVIGLLRGTDPEMSKQAVIFSAHLDHIGVTDQPGDSINNGADDDATGVTAVLTLADAYAALPQKPKRSAIFMTFWGEEKGLLGSKQYAKQPAWPLQDTLANINLEMLGRPEPGANGKTWMTGWHQSDLGKIMNQGAQRAGVLVFEHPRFSSFLYSRSDNWSLVEKGVIAHSFSAGSLHSDYHQPSDEWEKLKLDHMTKVVQGVFAGSLPIINGDATPKKSPGRRPIK